MSKSYRRRDKFELKKFKKIQKKHKQVADGYITKRGELVFVK